MRTVADLDADLVDRAAEGDLGAFAALVEEHRDVVHRVAARVVGEAEAEDVSQDAFLAAFNRLGRFRREGTFRAWLLQITHNTALNALARRRPEPVDPAERLGDEAAPEGERTPVWQLEQRERAERLEMKLASLRPPHRVVLVLRDLEGLSYEEIARVTDTPIGSVKGRLHRARGELIELLRANSYDWELPS